AQEFQNITSGTSTPLRNSAISRAGRVHHSGMRESHALESSTARESWNLTRWDSSSLRNCRISRAGRVHRSGIVESRGGNSPPLGNRRISPAAAVPPSEIAEFRAQEEASTQKSQNPTRRKGPSQRNRRN